ncbi:ubinuclein-2, partial [Elysia marginata]
MSNLKRIQLTSVDPPKKDNKPKRKAKTFRFELSLGESNAETCPEYSFAELIKNEKPAASDDPFNDDVDMAEVAAIAQRFEAKYGPKSAYSGKKKRTREMDDYYDLGDGYDIDDPFIDNTEAYDEVVPSTLTTKHGGFYINQGQLDFRSLSDDSFQAFTSPAKAPTGKKKKKNVLNSDSEEETGESLAKKFKAMKRKKLLESKALEKKRKKLSDGTDGESLIKKKKKKNPQKLMKKLSRLRESYGQSPSPASPGAILTPSTTAMSIQSTTTAPATATTATTNGVDTAAQQPQATVQTISSTATPVVVTSTTSATSTEPLISNGGESTVVPGLDSEEKSGAVSETMRDESSSKSGDEGRGDQQSGDKITQLPAQLPVEMFNSIERLKKCAKGSTEGKCKFFTAEVNKLLLEIEIGSYGLAWGSRTAIFGHLGDHLPCGKPALLRRAKKLHENQEEEQLREPTQRLKKAIDEVMPALQEQYRQELLKAKAEAERSVTTDGPKEEASTESEEEETKQEAATKKPKRPKRIFSWTKETRQYLKNVVVLKMKGYKSFKSRNQTAVEYIKAFLDTTIRQLWPPGWMQTRTLLKESRMCHEELAKTISTPQNKEKAVPPSGKPWPSVSSESNTTTGVVAAATSRPSAQPHVSKTEDMVEISSQSEQETERVVPQSKDLGSRDVVRTGGDTIVVDLPGSSPSVVPSTRPLGPSSSSPKLSLPPVEVIDITDSPVKSSPTHSTISQSLIAGDKIPAT